MQLKQNSVSYLCKMKIYFVEKVCEPKTQIIHDCAPDATGNTFAAFTFTLFLLLLYFAGFLFREEGHMKVIIFSRVIISHLSYSPAQYFTCAVKTSNPNIISDKKSLTTVILGNVVSKYHTEDTV